MPKKEKPVKKAVPIRELKSTPSTEVIEIERIVIEIGRFSWKTKGFPLKLKGFFLKLQGLELKLKAF